MGPRRTPPDRRARQVLVGALALFAAAQLAAGALIDYRYPLLRFPSARAVLARAAGQPGGPDVVFAGSSRFIGDFREQEMASLLERGLGAGRRLNVLNAAVPGGDPTAQERVLEHLLEAGARPRLVVLEVGPEFFNWYNPPIAENSVRLVRWEDLPRQLPAAARSSRLGRLLSARLVPIYEHREELRAQAAALWRTGRTDGPLAVPRLALAVGGAPAARGAVAWDELLSGPAPGPSEEVQALIRGGARWVGASWLRRYRITGVNRQALVRTARRCRAAGAEVMLVTPPVTALLRGCYTPAIEQAYQALLRELTAELGCRHVDCRDWLPDGFFSDVHHVTPQGGERFTRLFARRVLVPPARSGSRGTALAPGPLVPPG